MKRYALLSIFASLLPAGALIAKEESTQSPTDAAVMADLASKLPPHLRSRVGDLAGGNGKLLSEILPKDSPLLKQQGGGNKMVITVDGVRIMSDDPVLEEGSKVSMQVQKIFENCVFSGNEALIKQLKDLTNDKNAARSALFAAAPNILTFAASLEAEQKSLDEAFNMLIKLIAFIQGSNNKELLKTASEQMNRVHVLKKNHKELSAEVQKILS